MKLFRKKILFCSKWFLLALIVFNTAPVFARSIDAGNLHIEYEGNEALFNETNIYPGWQTTKTLNVKNTGKVSHSLSIAVHGSLGDLADVLLIEPLREDGTLIWSKSLANVAQSPNSSIILHSINPGETKQITLRAKLLASAGNEYQNSSTFAFDFIVGNESTDAKEPIILDETIKLNINKIIEKSVPAESTIVESNNKDVQINDPDAAVKGASTNNDKNIRCFWSWLLLIVMAIYLAIYSIIIRKKKRKMAWLLPVVMAVLIFFMHLTLSSIYEPTKWCDYFIYLLIAELLSYFVIEKYILSKKPQ